MRGEAAMDKPRWTSRAGRAISPSMAPLIVTLGFPPPVLAHFEALRRRHFPPERNQIPAHATLFHALPGEAEARLRARLMAETVALDAPEVAVTEVRFTGRGVAYALASEPVARLRRAIATDFDGGLTPQDAQGWRPHVTVQNKVDPGTARALHAALAAAFEPFHFAAESLLLWRYRGGPWEALGAFPFRAP